MAERSAGAEMHGVAVHETSKRVVVRVITLSDPETHAETYAPEGEDCAAKYCRKHAKNSD
jgi:hypothetical protein